jgi:uncharacterized protein (DUF924 family)
MALYYKLFLENNDTKYSDLALLFGNHKIYQKLNKEYIIDENLYNITQMWYKLSFNHKPHEEISEYCIIENWKNLWFAKNQLQKEVDIKLKNYEFMINEYINYKPTHIIEYIGLIILYDQFTRNIYRGSPEAYKYDYISRQYSLYLLELIDYLPTHFIITIIICLIHSENLDIQKRIKNIVLTNIKLKKLYTLYPTIKQIINNHYERILFFGRIPERNIILNRKSTNEEICFMQCL